MSSPQLDAPLRTYVVMLQQLITRRRNQLCEQLSVRVRMELLADLERLQQLLREEHARQEII